MSKSTDERFKMIDRIIAYYKAQKLRLKATDIQSNVKEEQAEESIHTRMVKGYNKNKDQIEKRPKRPEVPQTEKRKRKLADLLSRSSSWRGLSE